MVSKSLRRGLPLLLLFMIGCNRYQEMAQVDTAWFQTHVGQSVKMSGCLTFACITVPGAQYPRDCVAGIVDASGTNNVGLEFTADKTDVRARIDKFYSSIGRGCLMLGITGLVIEHRCADTDTSCVTSYSLEVASIEAFTP
jgi:hypothetical protein